MTRVVDASVAIKWFVREVHHEPAQALLYAHGGDLEAPDLLLAEIGNIAWNKLVRKEIEGEQARAILGEARDYLAVLHPSADLIEQALEIAVALTHPLHDGLYLACAMKVGAPLVTADARLLRAVKETDYEPIVRFVGDA